MFRLSQEGEVARLVIDRPKARNAIPLDGWRALAARIGEIERSPARLLVLSGAGGAFCAGADLDDFALLNRDEAARSRFREEMRDALDRLRGLAVPAVAAIEGPCFGAGVALAMACDLRLAAADARFAITPAKIGISYPQEDVHRLVQLVGPGQAARLLFTAATIGADEAVRIGLVEALEAEAGLGAVIEAILANDQDSLAALKRGLRLTAGGRWSDADQDRRFDALIGGEALAGRLEALRRKW
ncbi:MAG TPA: enoyl-CoA hydratase/isomerase family protein [Allosphingosinicella sp.]|nr:enoyl-CoA hydratase/isomerase family protein [Allosphingosinicella sp.]